MKFLVVVAVLVSTVAFAEEPSKEVKPQGLITITAQNYPQPMFQLGAGGCLRGPMTFFDPAGNIVTHIDAGKWLPAECEPKAAPK
jgi:uncharacterized protein YdeI (BOF family)